MKHFFKLTLVIGLALILSLSLYLLAPSPESWFVKIGEFPVDAPIAVDAEIECSPHTLYVTNDYSGSSDDEVLNDRCFELQESLVSAARHGDVEKLSALIANGAILNSPGMLTDFEKPLPQAVWSGNTVAVKLMLDNGGDPNDYQYCCMSHKSLLTIAASKGDAEMMKLLISRGADPKFVGQFGESVADAVKRSGNKDVLDLFKAVCDKSIRCRFRSRSERLLSVLGLSKNDDSQR
jgi:hypothetical protein